MRGKLTVEMMAELLVAVMGDLLVVHWELALAVLLGKKKVAVLAVLMAGLLVLLTEMTEVAKTAGHLAPRWVVQKVVPSVLLSVESMAAT